MSVFGVLDTNASVRLVNLGSGTRVGVKDAAGQFVGDGYEGPEDPERSGYEYEFYEDAEKKVKIRTFESQGAYPDNQNFFD